MSGTDGNDPGHDNLPADPVGEGGAGEPAQHDRGRGNTAQPPAPARRRRLLPGRSRVRIKMPTQDDLDRLPADVRMELRNQQRAERHQWLNSLGILFGVLFTAGSLVATGLTLRTAQEDLRTSQENLRLAREGQFTDRYAKTLEALTDDDATIRLGAIHALNRLLSDSPRDRAAITAVLAGFIRSHDPAPTTENEELPSEPSVDIAAALSTLASNPLPVPPLDLHGVRVPHSDLQNANFNGANLSGATLFRADLVQAKLSGANLTDANLHRAKLIRADLRDAVLSRTDLRDAYLTRADLSGAYPTEADLRDAQMTGTILHRANLSRANLTGAYLLEANLTGASLLDAQLRDVDLSGADLRGADLRGADLRGARLSNAFMGLSGELLRVADLRGANLEGANLRGADLRQVRFSVGVDEIRRVAVTDGTTRW